MAVEFVGYSGCYNGTHDMDGDGTLDTEWSVIDEGFLYMPGSETKWCKCYSEAKMVKSVISGQDFAWVDAGSMYCSWTVREAKALTSPTIDFSLAPRCDKCRQAYENGSALVNDWGQGTNDVKACEDCALGSAQAIRWTAWASPVWTDTPSQYLVPRDDNNMVNGTAAPVGGLFRGKQASEIEFSLIPARYNDAISCETCGEEYAYRLQFSKTTIGDTVDFRSNVEWHNTSIVGIRDFRDPTSDAFQRYYGGGAAGLINNFIDGDISSQHVNFIDEPVANEVHFRLTLAKVRRTIRRAGLR